MESTRSLAQVIMEMRDEIKKLEDENRELRGDSGHWSVAVRTGETSLGSAASASASASAAAAAAAAEQQNVEENHSVNLRRNVSAPVLDGQYKETSVMTVRRYSVGSNLSANLTLREGRSDRMRRSDAGWRRLQEEMHHGSDVFANSGRGETGKVNNRHSLQEYVHKNRAKVKTVTFLLPVDDIYTNRPALYKHQGEPAFSQLTSIDETDS
nr:uncharacterized protein LOC122773221 [Solea senegalensis]